MAGSENSGTETRERFWAGAKMEELFRAGAKTAREKMVEQFQLSSIRFFFQKMLILAFKTNSASSVNCTFFSGF